MAKDDATKGKNDDKKGKKPKKGDQKGKKGDQKGAVVLSVARHPRAGPQVRRAKGWGGFAGFLAAAFLSYRANLALVDIGLRALAVGVAGYVIAWAASVTVWRVVLMAELRELHEQLHPPQVAPSGSTDAPRPKAAESGGSGAK